jgi:hypothetical protein
MADSDDTGGFVRIGGPDAATGGFKRLPKGKGASGGDPGGSTLGALWRGFTGAVSGAIGRDVQTIKQLPGAIAQLPQVARQQAQANAGKTLAQRAQNPQDMQTALILGTMVQPNLSPKVAMAAPPATAAQKLAQDFKGAGVPPSIPAVGQGHGAGLAANLGRGLPFSPIAARMQQGLAATRDAAGRAAAGLGNPQDMAGAGNIARNAVNRVAADTSQAAKDYGDFFTKMAGAPPIPLTKTNQTLKDIMGRFKSAPGLRGLFTSPTLQKLASELEPRTVNVPAKTSAMLGPTGQPIVTAPAQTLQKGGFLSLPELKELRTQIGYQLEHPNFGPDQIPRAQLKRVYGSLTQDMQAAARKQGPEAVKALNRATINYGTRMRTLDRLEPLIKGDAGEATFAKLNNAARSSGGADAGLLRTLKANATPQEWGDIAATMVRRLGEPPPGAKDVLEDEPFSVSSYVTNWNKLSDAAKDVLFGDLQMGSPRVGLERLARVAQSQKNVGKLANTSHSGEMGVMAGVAASVVSEVAMGRVPWASAIGLTGGYGVAKLLMSPGFARWLYQLPKAVAGAPSEEIALQRGATLLGQTMMQPNPQHTPGQPPSKAPEPRVSDRIGAARKVGELSTKVYEAKRRGDLDEAQKLMRRLAEAQTDFHRTQPSQAS